MTRVNINGINEMDFPSGVTSASTSAGVTTVNLDSSGAPTFVSEQPSGIVPGSVFTTTDNPASILAFYVDGTFVPPNQYSVSGSTITLETAVSSGQIPWVVYTTTEAAARWAATVMGLNDFNQSFNESTGTMDAMQFIFSQFQQQQPLPNGATDASTLVYNGKIYVIGGYGANATTYLTYVQIYDPVTNSWAQGSPITTGVWGAGCAVYNGKIYMFGGATSATGQSGTTLALVYDIAGDAWSSITALPVVMADGTMAVTVGNKIYVMWQSDFYEYDPVGDSYTSLTSAPSPAQVQWAATGLVNVSGDDRIYFIGGSTGSSSGYTNVNYYYSVTSSTWSSAQATAPYSAHGLLQGAVLDGKIYYIGGYDGSVFYQTLYAYDTSANTWSSALAVMNEWRDGVSGGFVDGILYVIGGRNAGNSLGPFGVVANEAFEVGSSVESRTFTSIEINYTSGTSGNVRLGIYADSGSGPGALILDAGAVAIANGWIAIRGLNLSLTPGTRYWLAFIQDSSMGVSYTDGSPASNATTAHCFVAQAYGALPGTFPSGATFLSSMYAMRLTT